MPARRANLHEPVETEKSEPVDEAAEKPADETEDAPKDDETPDESEVATEEPETSEPEGWYPGQPCLNCGARAYKWTTGWGTGCSACAPENQVEED